MERKYAKVQTRRNCKTCAYWSGEDKDLFAFCIKIDIDTNENRHFRHVVTPKHDAARGEVFVNDEYGFDSRFITSATFGCVLHEQGHARKTD